MTRPRSDALSLPAKLGLLAALYVAQGLPFGFFTQSLPALMRARGYRLSEISYSALLVLPWAGKALWAPLVDRWPTPTPTVRARRFRWIAACQVAAALVFLALAAHGRLDRLPPLFVGFFLLNLASATQDIATDGFAVDMLRGGERGYANGVQVAGYRGGMVLGGGVLLIVLDRIGPAAAFGLLAAATLALSLPLLLVREAPPHLEDAPAERPRLPHFLRTPAAARVLAVVVTYKLAESLVAGVLRPFLVDRGFSLAEIGAVSGVAGSMGGLLGALTGGAIASRLGARRATWLAGLVQTACVLGFAAVSAVRLGGLALGGLFFVEAFASSLATATLFAAMMDWCRPLVGATDYTVQASAIVIATGAVTLVSGRLAEAVGYPAHFAIAGGVGVASLLVLRACYPRAVVTGR